MSEKSIELFDIPQDDYLDSFETAENLVEKAVESHDVYWKLIDVCEEHIRGKKPKNPWKLKEAGLHWSNNWNWLKARTQISRVTLANIDLVKSAIELITPEFRRPKKDDGEKLPFLLNEDDRGVVSMKIARSFIEALEKEGKFNTWLNNIEYPATAYGYDTIVFDGEDDWMGQPVHPRNIAFEDHTEPDELKVFVIFKLFKANVLWQKWIDAKNVEILEHVDTEDNPTDIRSTNWSVDGLESLLWNALSGKIKKSQSNSKGYEDWEEVTSAIRKGDKSCQYFIGNTENVNIAKIFYKELNGRWTETYIPFRNNWQNSGKGNDETGDAIIFKKKHKKKHQDRLAVLVKDSPFTEGGYVHEFRGLAKYSVEDSMRFNRKKNNIEDKLLFSGSPFFEQSNSQQKERFKITPSQGFTLVKKGFPLIPDQPQFDLTNHLLSIEMDEKHFKRETEHFDARVQDRLSSRPVKDEVIQKSKEVQDVKTAKHGSKFSDYSKLLFSILQNLVDLESPDKDESGYDGYSYFFEELEYELADFIPDGVKPKEFVKEVVKSVSSVSIEPVLTDVEALQLAISMSETSYARNRLKRMLLMVQGFPRREIDRIAPLPIDSFRNLRDERVAKIENDMFWTTNDVVLSPEDDHIDHLNEHYKKFQTTAQGISQGRLDIVNGFKYLANLLSHSEEHLNLMRQDPTLSSFYEQLLPVQDEFVSILGGIKSAAEQEARKRQEEEQNAIPPEKQEELRILEFEKVNKQRRTEELTKHQMALKQNKQQQDQALKAQEQKFQQDLEVIRVEAENKLNVLKEAAKVF